MPTAGDYRWGVTTSHEVQPAVRWTRGEVEDYSEFLICKLVELDRQKQDLVRVAKKAVIGRAAR